MFGVAPIAKQRARARAYPSPYTCFNATHNFFASGRFVFMNLGIFPVGGIGFLVFWQIQTLGPAAEDGLRRLMYEGREKSIG